MVERNSFRDGEREREMGWILGSTRGSLTTVDRKKFFRILKCASKDLVKLKHNLFYSFPHSVLPHLQSLSSPSNLIRNKI